MADWILNSWYKKGAYIIGCLYCSLSLFGIGLYILMNVILGV